MSIFDKLKKGAAEAVQNAAKSAVKCKKVYAPSGNDYEAAYENYLELEKIMNI